MLNYKLISFVWGLLGLALVSGCSNIKTYSENYPDNMQVKTRTDSGSFFSSLDTVVHIYRLNNKCESDYLGTVEFEDPVTDIGLPVNQLLYLDFVFINSSYGSSSSMSHETLLRPKKGARYEVALTYLDALYDVELWERRSRKAARKPLTMVPYEACKPAK